MVEHSNPIKTALSSPMKYRILVKGENADDIYKDMMKNLNRLVKK